MGSSGQVVARWFVISWSMSNHAGCRAGLETRGQSELRDWERHALKAEVATSTGSFEKGRGEGV